MGLRAFRQKMWSSNAKLSLQHKRAIESWKVNWYSQWNGKYEQVRGCEQESSEILHCACRMQIEIRSRAWRNFLNKCTFLHPTIFIVMWIRFRFICTCTHARRVCPIILHACNHLNSSQMCCTATLHIIRPNVLWCHKLYFSLCVSNFSAFRCLSTNIELCVRCRCHNNLFSILSLSRSQSILA